MCICVCICANNMQILGFGGVGGLGVGGDTIGGEGGVWGSGDRAHIYICACIYIPSVSIGPRKCPMFANRAVLDFPTASGLDLEKSALNWARLGLEILTDCLSVSFCC